MTTTRGSRIPVLTRAPAAYFVGGDGDSGLKQTDKFIFTNEVMIADEIAVIVPVPDSVLADSEFAIWSQLGPLLGLALARRLDGAVLFGTGKPASWGLSLYEDAVLSSNSVPAGTGPVVAVLGAAGRIGDSGYIPSGAVVRRG